MYADLGRLARQPNPPDDSPSTRSLAEPMTAHSRENPELSLRWQPLVAESPNGLRQPQFSGEQMRDFLLITAATNDDASLAAYFESIAGDWRDHARRNSDGDLRDAAAERLLAAGRNDLAQAYVPTPVGVPPPPVALFDRALHAVIDPILAPMMAPKERSPSSAMTAEPRSAPHPHPPSQTARYSSLLFTRARQFASISPPRLSRAASPPTSGHVRRVPHQSRPA